MTENSLLVAPVRYDSLGADVTSFDDRFFQNDTRVVLSGYVADHPQRVEAPNPRLNVRIADARGRQVVFALFGPPKSASMIQAGSRLRVSGTLKRLDHAWSLSRAEVVHGGSLSPVYPSVYGSASQTKAIVVKALSLHVRTVANRINDQLRELGDLNEMLRIAGCGHVGVDGLLRSIHAPHLLDEAAKSLDAMDRLSAIHAILNARRGIGQPGAARWNGPPSEPDYWIERLPFEISQDQRQAIKEIVTDLGSGKTMRRLLVGDVGTGKTAVFVVAAVAALMGGARVAVLMPSDVLAHQVASEIACWFPELSPNLALVVGSNSVDKPERYPLVVGTTALLSRDASRDFVVIDEQQRYSRAQRDRLSRNGSHALEVSATPIPRSQALLKLGIMDVSAIRARHTDRKITTRLWPQSDRGDLFGHVRKTIASGGQVLVVYPRRSGSRESVEGSLPGWEAHFPGRVRCAHGGCAGDANRQALEDMRSGKADILIASTVVEVGLNLPLLRRAVIVKPGLYGLTQLHQIRGRLARGGGEGAFDLLAGADLSIAALQRLQVLVDIDDGFEIARRDLEFRGAGDLSALSDRQSGVVMGFMSGRPLSQAILDETLDRLSRSKAF